MILPDVNVLVHAHNADSATHDRARHWWDACLSGTEGIGLAWATILGFVRITTNRKVVARPLPVHDVMEQLESWLALPHVHIAQPSDRHFARFRAETERLGIAGNLTTDAHLAVLAMERGYVLYSTDADFARFPGLRWVNPCQEARGSSTRQRTGLAAVVTHQ
jgi:toxin-antitoxin system PIN domain toxin